jgi:hypothetical protein
MLGDLGAAGDEGVAVGVAAGVSGSTEPAAEAREAARRLLDAV